MKNAIDIKTANAVTDNVIIAMRKIPNHTDSGLVKGLDGKSFELPGNYMGKILDYGNQVEGVSVGDYALFHKVAGHHILTDDKEMIKVIKKINLLIVSKSTGMKVENVGTIGDRILVDTTEVFEEEKSSKGIITKGKDAKLDNAHGELNRGVIIKLSDNAKAEGYKEGDVVYFGLEVGLKIKEIKGPGKYLTLYWQDVSFFTRN